MTAVNLGSTLVATIAGGKDQPTEVDVPRF